LQLEWWIFPYHCRYAILKVVSIQPGALLVCVFVARLDMWLSTTSPTSVTTKPSYIFPMKFMHAIQGRF